MRRRKNYRDLTDVERDDFVQALYRLKSDGVVDQLADEHATFFNQGIHRSSHFLPWHRDFLRRFEDALRTSRPDVTIPYWNSTVDTSPSDPLWDNDFLGQFDAAWGLRRALGSDTLPTPQRLQNTLGRGTYDTFRRDVENLLHNPPHNWVSGVMASLASPGDPIFYLHHCWIDLLWAQRQLLNPGAPFVSSGPGFGLNDPMTSVGTTPADVLDHRLINLYDYPPGFQPDPPQVLRDTPAM
ncbi:MAG: tyrosinase [Pseudonocardiales bacterium]|nr:MAG: tyrosinase [Pseudonocardiales bacterium]